MVKRRYSYIQNLENFSVVADPDYGFFPPRIPDPRSNNDNKNKKEEGEK
jgi:hypothetical protein